MTTSDAWPALPFAEWRDTKETLHMYTQVIGKLRLALSPPEPEWAHVALYVDARGLTSGPIPYEGMVFQADFDFIEHALSIRTSDGGCHRIALVPRSVAEFYDMVMRGLRALGVEVAISTMPQEVPDPTPFPEDEIHDSYDAAAVNRFWRALVHADRVLRVHRADFRGRSSPVHFFWGTFDMAYTRYSGREAAPPANAGVILRRSADAEEICAGFWPGDDRYPRPAFYAYAYPKPEGLERAEIRPRAAAWNEQIGEFLLDYDDIRSRPDPGDDLLAFVRSTYDAGASLAGWDSGLVAPPASEK
jgi:hypothetical protein